MHEEEWTCSPPLVHNTHIVGCEEIIFCIFRKKSQHCKDLITYQGGHMVASYGNLQVSHTCIYFLYHVHLRKRNKIFEWLPYKRREDFSLAEKEHTREFFWRARKGFFSSLVNLVLSDKFP